MGFWCFLRFSCKVVIIFAIAVTCLKTIEFASTHRDIAKTNVETFGDVIQNTWEYFNRTMVDKFQCNLRLEDKISDDCYTKFVLIFTYLELALWIGVLIKCKWSLRSLMILEVLRMVIFTPFPTYETLGKINTYLMYLKSLLVVIVLCIIWLEKPSYPQNIFGITSSLPTPTIVDTDKKRFGFINGKLVFVYNNLF